MLVLQFALIARFKAVAAPFGIDALLQYHVQISFVALAFALAHPVLLFFADSKYLALLNLLTAPWARPRGIGREPLSTGKTR